MKPKGMALVLAVIMNKIVTAYHSYPVTLIIIHKSFQVQHTLASLKYPIII